jgi:hypothetical protein
MFAGEDKFITDLKTGPDASPDHVTVIAELFKDPDFQKIWNYLKNCKIRISLAVGKVVIDKEERFGGFNGSDVDPGITINAHKQEHQDNPQELADTIIHELIHAVLKLRNVCGENNYPLDAKINDLPHNSKAGNHSRDKNQHKGDDKKYMDENYGDSASAPKTEYIDENLEAQKFIAGIIKKLIKSTGKGKPTLTSKNVEKLTGKPV